MMSKTEIILTENDIAALRDATQIMLADPHWTKSIKQRLQEDGELETGQFCSYCCQYDSLGLAPWQTAPMDSNPSQKDDAGRLLEQMLALGVSTYAADPIAAIEAATSK
jgi:hypothetical protein